MVRFPLKLWSSILFPGLLSSPCSISPGFSLTDMSEGKIWNKVPTRLVGESLERQSLLLSRRTFSPAAQDRRMLGMGLHRTSCHQLIPFHTKPRAPGCPEMALTIEGAWCRHCIKPQPGPECLPLQKHTEQASGGEPISPPRCEMFAGRKTINVSAMRRKLQLYLLEQHCLFQRHQEPNTWVFQHLLRNAFEERWLLGSRVWKQSPVFPGRRDELPALFHKLMTCPPSRSCYTESMIFALPLAIEGQDVLVVM